MALTERVWQPTQMDMLALFGATVRRLRLKAGYSQESFADLVDMHRNYIGTVERGETNVSLESITRIAQGLRIPLSALFAEMENPGSTDGSRDASRPASSSSLSRYARVAHLQPAISRVFEAQSAIEEIVQHLQSLNSSDEATNSMEKPDTEKRKRKNRK